MATLESWPDGYMLDMDPRREDPLFYYRTDDWSEAIGIEVLPLYQERDAEEVEISVFREHRGRELALEEAAREELYRRAVPAIVARHQRWKQVLLRGTNLDVVLASGSLSEQLNRLGFAQKDHPEADAALWCRE